MIDTRCYACAENMHTEEDMQQKLAIKEYKGHGIFKCPWCGDILDLSSATYLTKISREYNEDGELFTNFIEHDPKLNEEGTSTFEEDTDTFGAFDGLPFGKYLVEVYWLYYQCGGYEYPNEWDVKIELLSEEELK